MARRVSSDTDAGGLERAGSRGSRVAGAGGAPRRGSFEAGSSGVEQEGSGHSVLLMGVASDGRVWQWQLPLLHGTLPEGKPSALPPAPKPELLGGCRPPWRFDGWQGPNLQASLLQPGWLAPPGRRGGLLQQRHLSSRSLVPACHPPLRCCSLSCCRADAHAAAARHSIQRRPRPRPAAGGARRRGPAGGCHRGRWEAGRWHCCADALYWARSGRLAATCGRCARVLPKFRARCMMVATTDCPVPALPQALSSCWRCSRARCCRCTWRPQRRWRRTPRPCRQARLPCLPVPCGRPAPVLANGCVWPAASQSLCHLDAFPSAPTGPGLDRATRCKQGLRWLGASPRLVSHSTEKVAGGYRNTLLITGAGRFVFPLFCKRLGIPLQQLFRSQQLCRRLPPAERLQLRLPTCQREPRPPEPLPAPSHADVRNRLSLPFRPVPCDPVPLGGVRASPSGRYILLLFRCAWQQRGGPFAAAAAPLPRACCARQQGRRVGLAWRVACSGASVPLLHASLPDSIDPQGRPLRDLVGGRRRRARPPAPSRPAVQRRWVGGWVGGRWVGGAPFLLPCDAPWQADNPFGRLPWPSSTCT